MAFIFENQADTQKIFNISWTFRDSHIIIQHWPPDKSLAEVDLGKIRLWVQAYNLPVVMMNMQTAKFIGNDLGEFLKADLASPSHKWKRSLRIQIQFDISKPLKDHVLIPRTNLDPLSAEVRYERLSEFCYGCGLLGHKISGCDTVTTKNTDGETLYNFGSWLKAENTLIQNPHLNPKPKIHVTQKTQINTISEQNSDAGKSIANLDYAEPSENSIPSSYDVAQIHWCHKSTAKPTYSHNRPVDQLFSATDGKTLMRQDLTSASPVENLPNSLTKGDLHSLNPCLPNLLTLNSPPKNPSLLGPIPKPINLPIWAFLTNLNVDQNSSPITQKLPNSGLPISQPITGLFNRPKRNIISPALFSEHILKKPKIEIPKFETLTLNAQISPQIKNPSNNPNSSSNNTYPISTEPILDLTDLESIHMSLSSPYLLSYKRKIFHIKRHYDGTPFIQKILKSSISITEIEDL